MQEIDFIEDDLRAYNAMLRDLFRKGINTLDKIDRYIIRHQFTLFADETRIKRYKYEYSKDIAKRFNLSTADIVRRRCNAIIKIKEFVCRGFPLD